MMGVRRRKLGRFGIGHGVASVAVVAMLAASPALVSVVSTHTDGTGLVIAETVFGGPVTAQETPAGSLERCVAHANNAYQECLDATRWYLEFKCWVALQFRLSACLIDSSGF